MLHTLHILANSATAHSVPPDGWNILLFLLGIVIALLGNAFFVAAEFAVARVRPSQLEENAKSMPRRTAAAKYVVANLDSFLSACQFGITVFSLILGFLGEPLVDSLARPLLTKLCPNLVESSIIGTKLNCISAISFTIAMLSFTALHVVVGELVPKSFAIRRSVITALALARPLIFFSHICSIPIRMMNSTANSILINIFRIQPVSEHAQAHTAEELAYLVAESERNQKVTETEREIMENALELNEVWVRDVMTHRGDVVFLDADQPIESNLEIAMRSKHTRFPLCRGNLENTLGLIHIKDILSLIKDPAADLMHIKRDIKVVPETMPLDVLLKFFLKEKAHFALVADEFGHIGGIVFLDNVIEELVGDIQDEFDNEKPEFVRINEHEFVIEGTTTLNDLAHYEEELYIESGEVTTVGGYITQILGRFPERGETLEILGYTARVTSVGERMVGQVHFTKTQQNTPSTSPAE